MYSLRADLFERGTESQFYSDRLAYWIFLIAFCPKTRATTSRRFAIVEVEHPTESLVPADHPNFLYRARHRADQPIVQPLMISLPVVMVHVFGHGTA